MVFTRKELCDSKNLHLAWKRIQTSTRYEYKELCSEVYAAFGWHVDRKIELFSSEIQNCIYKPIHSSKFYQPKSSGLVRPITILSVKDQIFYQAITNLICEGQLQKIRRFRRGTVFGGFNIQNPSSEHFLAYWKEEYKSYKGSVKNNFKLGFEWICKFDLASFYDTIDHKILIETICSDVLDDDLQKAFLGALNLWSQPQSIELPYSQGIPQGPSASQAIADLYLNYLDSKMKDISIQYNLRYFRYVDDIVLMGKQEKEIKRGLIQLDIIARELALVPQSAKIEIKKVEAIENEMKGENSLIEMIGQAKSEDIKNETNQQYLRTLFIQSISVDESGDVELVDATAFKFSLYRLNPDIDIAGVALKIIKTHFHLVSICILYINGLGYNQEIDNSIFKLISEDPIHDWYTAQLLDYKHIHNSQNINDIYTLGLKIIDSNNKHWFLKRKFLKIFKNHPDKDFIFTNRFQKKLKEENFLESQLPYYLALLTASYSSDSNETHKVLSRSEGNK